MKAAGKYLLLLCCVVCLRAHAQDAVALSHYVFPVFSKGRVQQKDGGTDEAMLNYNVLSKEIVFEPTPGQYRALAYPEKAATIVILDRKFVLVNHEFYELLGTAPWPLLLQYTCTIKEPGTDIGYGMSSVTTASPAIKSLIQSGGAYTLKLPDGFQVMTGMVYWIFKDGKYQKVNSAKQLIAAAPEKKEKINELVKKNNTNFTKKQDMIDLIRQLF